MRIINHKLDPDTARFVSAQSAGGRLVNPVGIVLHDTADIRKGGAVDWFTSAECPTSAHVVVERDGTITQLVKFDTVAYHAGKSMWNGHSGCNSNMIGIEIVNPGALDKDGRAWFHKKGEKGFDVATLQRVKTKEHGDAWWMPYTPEQIATVKELCKTLVACYPSIDEIVTHWLISPGRKVDTNPMFPLDEVRKAAFAPRGEAVVAALPIMQPEPAKAPSMVKAATESKSAIAIVIAGIQLVISNFTDWMGEAWNFVLWAMGVLPTITAEVKDTLTSSEEVAKWLHIEWKTISITVALATLAVVLIRHINDKRRLATHE